MNEKVIFSAAIIIIFYTRMSAALTYAGEHKALENNFISRRYTNTHKVHEKKKKKIIDYLSLCCFVINGEIFGAWTEVEYRWLGSIVQEK